MFKVTVTKHLRNGKKEKVITKLYLTAQPIINLYKHQNSLMYFTTDCDSRLIQLPSLKSFVIEKLIVQNQVDINDLLKELNVRSNRHHDRQLQN